MEHLQPKVWKLAEEHFQPGGLVMMRVLHSVPGKRHRRIQKLTLSMVMRWCMTLFRYCGLLRNDKESFNTVRKLSPACYRFRIVDAEGQDILNRTNAGFVNGRTKSTFGHDEHEHDHGFDYTRVE